MISIVAVVLALASEMRRELLMAIESHLAGDFTAALETSTQEVRDDTEIARRESNIVLAKEQRRMPHPFVRSCQMWQHPMSSSHTYKQTHTLFVSTTADTLRTQVTRA